MSLCFHRIRVIQVTEAQDLSPEKDLETVLQRQGMGLFTVAMVGASQVPG